MIERDAALAIFGGALALAGVLLIFIGFILPKADSSYNATKADTFRWLARFGLVPFFSSLYCALASIWAIQGAVWSGSHLWGVLKWTLALTALYAIISTAVSTS